MNPVLDEILKTREVLSADGQQRFPLHSAMTAEEGELLQRLVLEVKPACSVEIGLAYGVSALYICDALAAAMPTGHHIVIDPYQNDVAAGWKGIGMANLRRAGFGDMVELIEKPSHLALPELESRAVKVDFALIDGWHTFDHTLTDFFHVDRILRPGGVLVIDDADMPPVRKVLRYIVTNRSYQIAARAGETKQFDWKRSVASAMASRWPFRAIAMPEWQARDEVLGLVGSCVALRKVADDTRGWDHHHAF